MSFFSRKFGSKKNEPDSGTGSRQARAETVSHLKEFVSTRSGCEAFIEPQTRVTQTTMVVVAGTGEWTRRRVPDQDAARKVASQLGIPAFDVNLSGYPSRMREWNQRKKR
ncbi:hypothetical protein [Demequina flava]|uniref:hypothetical protein n=1 Tax=Demequina flava TaxID=1095025 RepID=UPI0007820E52|nr:hypothetical protein [Demequina flava]